MLSIGFTHSSLSLLPRLVRLIVPSSGTSLISLLAWMARRSCSSSSYAASRLFMVERRFDAWLAEDSLPALDAL